MADGHIYSQPPFVKSQYDLLKQEYRNNPDKEAVVTIGIEKYNINGLQCERMVDYIVNNLK